MMATETKDKKPTAGNLRALFKNQSWLKTLRKRMGLGDTLGPLSEFPVSSESINKATKEFKDFNAGKKFAIREVGLTLSSSVVSGFTSMLGSPKTGDTGVLSALAWNRLSSSSTINLAKVWVTRDGVASAVSTTGYPFNVPSSKGYPNLFACGKNDAGKPSWKIYAARCVNDVWNLSSYTVSVSVDGVFSINSVSTISTGIKYSNTYSSVFNITPDSSEETVYGILLLGNGSYYAEAFKDTDDGVLSVGSRLEFNTSVYENYCCAFCLRDYVYFGTDAGYAKAIRFDKATLSAELIDWSRSVGPYVSRNNYWCRSRKFVPGKGIIASESEQEATLGVSEAIVPSSASVGSMFPVDFTSLDKTKPLDEVAVLVNNDLYAKSIIAFGDGDAAFAASPIGSSLISSRPLSADRTDVVSVSKNDDGSICAVLATYMLATSTTFINNMVSEYIEIKEI